MQGPFPRAAPTIVKKNQIQNKRNDFLIQDTVSKIACTWPRASPALRSFGWTHCTAAVTSDRHQTAATEIFTGKKTSSVYCEALGPDHINAAAARRVAGRQARASTTTVEHVRTRCGRWATACRVHTAPSACGNTPRVMPVQKGLLARCSSAIACVADTWGKECDVGM